MSLITPSIYSVIVVALVGRFETVQVSLIIVSLVCFTEKVHSLSPCSPIKLE